MASVVAMWRLKNGKPVGRLHLTRNHAQRLIKSECGGISVMRVSEAGTARWSADASDWPSLSSCKRCLGDMWWLRERAGNEDHKLLDAFEGKR